MLSKKVCYILLVIFIVFVFVGFIIYAILQYSRKNYLDGGIIPKIPYKIINENEISKSIKLIYDIDNYHDKNDSVDTTSIEKLKSLIKQSGLEIFINNDYVRGNSVIKPDDLHITYKNQCIINRDEFIKIIDDNISNKNDKILYDKYCFEILKILISTYYYNYVLKEYDKTKEIEKSDFKYFNDHREDICKINSMNKKIILKALSYWFGDNDSYYRPIKNYEKDKDPDGIRVFQRCVQQLVIYIVLSEIPLFITFFGFGRNITINKENYRLVIGTELYGNISLGELMRDLETYVDELMKNNNVLNLIIDLLLSYLCLQHFHISHGDYHDCQYVLDTNDYHLKLLDFDDSLYEPESNMNKVNLLIGEQSTYTRILTNIINMFDVLIKSMKSYNVRTFSEKIKSELEYISNNVINSTKNIVKYILSSTFDPINEYRTKIIKIINEKCILLNVDPIFGEFIYNCDYDKTHYESLY